MNADMAPARLLLIELTGAEKARNVGGDPFPFYAGLARARGAACCWLAWAVDGRVDPARGYEAALPAHDQEALGRALVDFAPTHVLVSERLAPAAAAALTGAVPTAEVVFMPDFRAALFAATWGEAAGPDALTYAWPTFALRAGTVPFPWLVADAPEANLLDVVPCYEARAMNPRLAERGAALRILGGSPCASRVRLAANPFLAGLALDDCPDGVGCSFCERSRWPLAERGDALALALAQLARVQETGQRGARDTGEYALSDARLVRHLESFFAALEERAFPPGVFHLSARLDDLLRAAPALERLLPRLAGAGHRLNILMAGVENFSPAEQRRFNKGFSPRVAKTALSRLAALRARHPAQLSSASFGFILFTPYTSLDDVAENLAGFAETGLPLCGHVLTSMVQLDPDTPLARAVARDGLARSRWEAPGMDYNASVTGTWRPGQQPWVFRHPEVAALYGALVRVVAHANRAIYPSVFDPAEPAAQAAAAFHEALDEPARDWPVLAVALLEAARAQLSGEGAETLLGGAAERLRDTRWRAARGLPPAPAPALPPAPPAPVVRSAAERRLIEGLPRLRALLSRLEASPETLLGDWRVVELSASSHEAPDFFLRLGFEGPGGSLRLQLRPPQPGSPAFFTGRSFRLSHTPDSTLDDPAHQKLVRRLGALLDRHL